MTAPAGPEPTTTPAPSRRLHDLDALRGFAMLLGIGLHAALAYFPTFWPVQDATSSTNGPYDEFLHAVHGFRMPLFFLLSGFFTAMLWRRRGLSSLVNHRLRRVALPLAVGLVTIVPLMNWVSEQASADQFDNLAIAVFFQNSTAVENLLEDGLDPDADRGDEGETPLHLAALVDNANIARLLLDAGADPFALDNDDDAPFGYAFYVGSDEVADVLVDAGFPDVRPPGTDWEDLEGWGFGAEDLEEDLGLDSWITSFHHLWFLWFLLWLVAGFALVAVAVEWGERRRGFEAAARTGVWPRRIMWALVPLTLIPQLAMGDGGKFPVFGPDTSTGLIPIPHVLIYYALFFAFGALMFGRRGRDDQLMVETMGRYWWAILSITVVILLPVALGLTFEEDAWLFASIAQVTYAWAMSIGLIGLFRQFLAKERRGIRYLSDSSYWLYLAHLPLVIVVQSRIRDWDLRSGVKFLGVTIGVTVVLLITYQLFVRYTPIGTMLNGTRTRPKRDATHEA